MEEGIEKRALHAETRQTWQVYEKAIETDKYYFLSYVNRSADVIPKSSFQTPEDADVFRGWQSGVDCYLTKPFNPMELLTFVKRIFDSQSGGGDEKRIKI
jgi:CheY-like chemotaxis protein